MTQINSYLTFNGNCREAMTFYKTCLGGELSFQTLGDSPLAEHMPQALKAYILHATLKKGSWMIMATDMVHDQGLVSGNAVSLMLHCSSEKEIQTFYERLATGGITTYPLSTNFWGALSGNLTDKYGNNWLLHFDAALQA
jgi:PhnB protein